MKCPTCDGKTLTYNSRDKDGARWRRRQCVNGHKFTTWEVTALDIDTAIGKCVDARTSQALTEATPLILAAIAASLKEVNRSAT